MSPVPGCHSMAALAIVRSSKTHRVSTENFSILCRCSSICPFELNSGLSDQEKRELRLAKGWVSVTYEEPIEDYGLRGLAGLLKQLPTLSKEERTKKATLLWERSEEH